jgi:hypothetical protein
MALRVISQQYCDGVGFGTKRTGAMPGFLSVGGLASSIAR